ncbi:hypothetical protein J3R83DRAFT_1609 [Lanmaoa asiatica]|nr:hypothetical protein J3R83DRAFT_1609 [Lanmaoa asiatica]
MVLWGRGGRCIHQRSSKEHPRRLECARSPNASLNGDLGSIANVEALLLLSGDPAVEGEPIRKGTALQEKLIILCSASKGKVLQQIKDGNPLVAIAILVQAKAKKPPTDAVPEFIGAYSTYMRVSTLVKETYHGKLISEWNQCINKLANKPEQVDMVPVLSIVMAVRDEDELTKKPRSRTNGFASRIESRVGRGGCERSRYEGVEQAMWAERCRLVFWCGTQPDIWVIPDDALSRLSRTSSKPSTPKRNIASLSTGLFMPWPRAQGISEWRSSFGSGALAMMINYFADLPDDTAIPTKATNLVDGYRFFEDTAAPTQEGQFKSPFLYELVGTRHMRDTTGYIPFDGLASKESATGKNGVGVIAIGCAALERALEFIRDGVINVEQVLTEMLESGDERMKMKSPKVFNKAPGRESTAPCQLSSQNWNFKTTAHKMSVDRRGHKFIQDVFTEAHRRSRRRNQKSGSTDTDSPGVMIFSDQPLGAP